MKRSVDPLLKDAVDKDLIKDGLGVALLEAQAANGFIIDAVSQNGDTMSVEDAIKAGLIPPRREEIIKRAEKERILHSYSMSHTTLILHSYHTHIECFKSFKGPVRFRLQEYRWRYRAYNNSFRSYKYEFDSKRTCLAIT